MRFSYKYFLFLIFLYPVLIKAQDSIPKPASKFLFGGYIKDLQMVSFLNNANQILDGGLIHNRLNFKYLPTEQITFTAEMRNRLYYGQIVQTNQLFSTSLGTDDGYLNLSRLIVNKRSLLLHSQFDRLNLDWHNDKWDITLGRQRINWGIALAWNPNDLFNAFNFIDFDYEERPGSDALRIQHFSGNATSFEIAASPGKTRDSHIAAMMYKFNKSGYDFQVFGAWYKKELAVGGGWAGNIKDAGFKGEISYFHPREKLTDTTGNLEASVTFDYTFKDGWYVNLSGLYNQQGQLNTFNLAQLTATTLAADNLMPFRYSLLAQASDAFTPIFTGSFGAMYAPGMDAVILLPTLSYSISNSWDINLIGQSFFARFNNKFQTAGNSVYLRLRWSF